MLDHEVNDRDQKKEPNNIHFPVSNPGEAVVSLENFTHLISLHRNYILIIPIGIYYAANAEVRIVSLNAI